MRRTIIAICLICLLTFSNAANMRRGANNTSASEKLESLKDKNQFAQNLFVTINLSLQSGSKVDEVIDFVKQAKSEAQSEKNALTKNYQAEKARLEEEIDEIEQNLVVLNQRLDIVVENIDELETNIDQLEKKLTRLQGEKQAVINRQQALEEAKSNDDEAFASRQRRDQNAISALEQIIPALENLSASGGQFLQKSQNEILLALRRIADPTPLKMLVELSSQFSQEKLDEVITKLEEILVQIQQNKAQDEADDEASNKRYQSLFVELQALYTKKTNSINAVTTELNSLKQSLRHNLKFRDDFTTEINENEALKASTEDVLQTTTETYNANLKAAEESIAALTEALNILTENEETLEVQEQNATEEV